MLIVAAVILYPILVNATGSPTSGASTTASTNFSVPNLTEDQFELFAVALNDSFIHGSVDVYAVEDNGGCGSVVVPPEIQEAEYDYGEPLDYGFLDQFETQNAALDFLNSRVACWTANNNHIVDSSADSDTDSVLGTVSVLSVWTEDSGNPFQFVQYSNVVLFYTGGDYSHDPIGVGVEMRNLVKVLFG